MKTYISPVVDQIWVSRYVQLAKYTVFDGESEFQVKNKQFPHPEAKNDGKLPLKTYCFFRLCLNLCFTLKLE